MLVAKYYYVAYSIFFHSKQEANIGTRSTGVHSKCFSLTARRMEQTSILVNRGWGVIIVFLWRGDIYAAEGGETIRRRATHLGHMENWNTFLCSGTVELRGSRCSHQHEPTVVLI